MLSWCRQIVQWKLWYLDTKLRVHKPILSLHVMYAKLIHILRKRIIDEATNHCMVRRASSFNTATTMLRPASRNSRLESDDYSGSTSANLLCIKTFNGRNFKAFLWRRSYLRLHVSNCSLWSMIKALRDHNKTNVHLSWTDAVERWIRIQ